ncbi:MAG TPA: DUF1345 domain-containing protein [Chthoniobacterales bacterium]|jgi:uncharacterized membrane protein|nr:DUF1345 domain-containing protein [Chthoniobacterales bacterium]
MNWIAKQDARHRIVISLALATAAWFAVSRQLQSSTRCIITWDTFSLSVLVLAWLTIITTPPDKLHARAQKQDLSHILIFVFVLVTACAGLFAVGFLFFSKQAFPDRTHFLIHLFGSMVAVICSWMLVHTVFGLRYAHTYYGDPDGPGPIAHAGGLQFPGDREPDYMDFAYFSFTIGMTFQVSDVVITSRDFRQLVLVHGMLSFGFNTVILALALSTVSNVLGQ